MITFHVIQHHLIGEEGAGTARFQRQHGEAGGEHQGGDGDCRQPALSPRQRRVRLALVRSVQANVATLSYAEVRELDAKLAEIQRRRG
jgi:hypothetical protein